MFKFTKGERIYLTERMAITKDCNGNEVLVGLTLEETISYMEYVRSCLNRDHIDRDAQETHLALDTKHEKARAELINVDRFIRTVNPTKH